MFVSRRYLSEASMAELTTTDSIPTTERSFRSRRRIDDAEL
jgi:hypothetical protein